MNRSLVVMTLILVAAAGHGCTSRETAGRAGADSSAAVAAPEPGGEHAPAGVVPGSYEDWCEEHQVAESMCTRCDPSLIPAFKLAGDWDEKHGLPKSQCTKCDPTLRIVRPPKAEVGG